MPFIRPMKSTVTVRKDDILVRCIEVKGSEPYGYEGPSCSIWHDKDWVYVSTDEHEGTAMLNIEALPALRRALALLAKQIKASPT